MGDLIKSDSGGLVSLLHGKGGGLDIPKPFERDIYLFDTQVAGTSYVEGIEELEPHLNIDDKLVDDLIKERGTMDKIYEYVTAFFGTKYWFYGHFHEYQMGHYEKMVYQMMPNIDDIKSFNKSLEELINENN